MRLQANKNFFQIPFTVKNSQNVSGQSKTIQSSAYPLNLDHHKQTHIFVCRANIQGKLPVSTYVRGKFVFTNFESQRLT